MKLVAQEDGFGCAVACVGFVLDISYREAVLLFENGKERAEGKDDFYCREIVSILNKLDKKYEFKYLKSRLRYKIYKQGTIVFIKRSRKYPYGHYLIRFENKWMDPWINLPNKNIEAGFRKRLPGKPIYAIYKI